jgi:hypothetical protein
MGNTYAMDGRRLYATTTSHPTLSPVTKVANGLCRRHSTDKARGGPGTRSQDRDRTGTNVHGALHIGTSSATRICQNAGETASDVGNRTDTGGE